MVAHSNISYQISDELRKDTTSDLLYGQYNQYQDIKTLQDMSEEFTGLLPTTLNRLSSVYKGAIITDPSIFSMFDSLKSQDKLGPILYLRSDLKTNYGIFETGEMSSLFILGSNSFNLKIATLSYFSFKEYFLKQFEFLLFVGDNYDSDYNSSMYLLISTGQHNTLQVLEQFENSLPQSINWLKAPVPTPTDASLRATLQNQIDFPELFVFAILIVTFVGFIEPRIIISSEVGIMRLRGFINKPTLSGSLQSILMTVSVLIIISIIGNLTIIGLVQFFNILSAVDLQVWALSSIIISVILGLFWSIGNISSLVMILRNPST